MSQVTKIIMSFFLLFFSWFPMFSRFFVPLDCLHLLRMQARVQKPILFGHESLSLKGSVLVRDGLQQPQTSLEVVKALVGVEGQLLLYFEFPLARSQHLDLGCELDDFELLTSEFLVGRLQLVPLLLHRHVECGPALSPGRILLCHPSSSIRPLTKIIQSSVLDTPLLVVKILPNKHIFRPWDQNSLFSPIR